MFDGLHVQKYGQFSTNGTSLQQPLFGGQPKHWLFIKPFYNGHLSTMATSSVPKVAIEERFNYSNKACGCEKWIQSNLAVD